jgi:NADPH:quinone reductase-like Zn-dependent oxidoreductase
MNDSDLPGTIPGTMTAVEIREPGGPEVLVPVSRPVPAPGPGEVLIKVAAAGVNRPDVLQRKGGYPPPPGASDIPGLELAGQVVALGADAGRWALGDRVTALVAGGGYAQYCTAPAVQCLPVPEGLDLAEAAALPETFFTVWSNVFDRGGLQAGESFLVHGGSSGIGTTAIQLARAFGARVSFLGGSTAEVDFLPMMIKRLTISGSTLRIRPIEFKAAIARQLEAKVWPLIAQGQVRPVMHQRFPLAEAAQAHDLMESGAHIGKIVLTV